MSLYDDASLVMIPSGYKDTKLYSVKPTNGDGDFTFSRGSSATRVNSAGLIEKERGNILYESNNFSSGYWNYRAGDSSTGGQAGYDGTNDAWLLSVTNGGWSVYQNYVGTGVHTFSLYVKAGTANIIQIDLFSASTTYSGQFNLSNGTDAGGSNSIDRNIISVGGGWYRVSFAANISSTLYARIGTVSQTGNFYIQDAQLEYGLVATDYIETTTSAVYEGITDDVPRVDYSGGGCPSLLLEPQRTNLVTNSEYLDDWLDAGTTTTLSSIINPSGYAQSYKIAASSSATNALRYDLTFSASTDYSYSVFLKAGTSEEVRMQIYDGNTFQRLAVNPLNNFAVVDQSGINSYSIEEYDSGWYRVVMNFTTTASAGSGYLQIYPDRTGNLNNVEAWGAMLEAGSYSTSYIPTYGVSSTRVADSCSKTGISDVIGQTEGTVYCEIDSSQFFTGSYIGISDGTTSNRQIFGWETESGDSGALRLYGFWNGVFQEVKK